MPQDEAKAAREYWDAEVRPRWEDRLALHGYSYLEEPNPASGYHSWTACSGGMEIRDITIHEAYALLKDAADQKLEKDDIHIGEICGVPYAYKLIDAGLIDLALTKNGFEEVQDVGEILTFKSKHAARLAALKEVRRK